MKEEDRVVHLLASLPESYDMLVTAIETNSDIPKMEVVVERLLHEERKQKDRGDSEQTHPKATTVTRSKEIRCYHCKKLGHIKRDCRALKQKQTPRNKESQQKANKADAGDQWKDDKGDDAIVVCHALQAGPTGNWIVDSGATCHMCSNKKLFVELQPLKKPMEVSLGDGHTLEAIGRGVVPLKMKLPNSSPRRCNLQDVLYVPALSYNLISVAKAAVNGKVTEFDDSGCQIVGSGRRVVAKATRVGSLYYLDGEIDPNACVAQASKEVLWHQHYGHLNVQCLQKLSRNNLVEISTTQRISSSAKRPSGASKQSQFSRPAKETKQQSHWISFTVTSVRR